MDSEQNHVYSVKFDDYVADRREWLSEQMLYGLS